MAETTATEIRDSTADPAPLGLLGFGMTTVLLNLHNAGFYELNSMILGMGLFYGGAAQVLAGIMEWKKKNTFGLTAFASYGLFWMSLAFLIVLPRCKVGIQNPSQEAMAAYMIVWGLFTAGLFFGTLRLNRALQFVFASLTLLYVLLGIGNFTGSAELMQVAGYEGIVCGLSAMYAGMAQVLNEIYGRTILSLYPVAKKD